MPQADIVTIHSFYPYGYERKIIIPPWTVLSGAEHKTNYMVRLEKGRIAVNTEHGIQVLQAPCTFQAKAGAQRIGRVFEEEVIWVDVYDNPDNCQDLEVLEARLFSTPNGLGDHRKIALDRQDYLGFVEQLGLTQDQIDTIVTNHDDLIAMPDGVDVMVKPSPIHGNGLFALRDFAAGEVVCPGRIDGHRTPAGRYTNHSANPNATSVMVGDDINAVALRTIHAGEEILISYRTAVKVNFGMNLEEMPCLPG